MKPISICAMGVLLILMSGCASTPSYNYYHQLSGDPIEDGYVRIQQGPPEDKILWQYATALEHMRRGQIDEAAALLDEALLSQEALAIDGGKKARQARKIFYPESTKIYIGEPYERVMAWFYRGVIYWMQGEPDNARACFKSAQLMDSDAEGEQYKADYAILDFMIGMINRFYKGDDNEAFRFAKQNAKFDYFPDDVQDPNLIIILEFGSGPTKYRGGNYGQLLKIRSRTSLAHSVNITLTDPIHIQPLDDVSWQAQTRGGRYMDHVLGRKAVFKEATSGIGDAAILSGAVIASETEHTQTGLIVAGVGILSKILSSASNPEADTRTWKNLPQYITLAPFKLPPGQYQASVQFLNKNGGVIPKDTKSININLAQNDEPLVVFVSQYSQ